VKISMGNNAYEPTDRRPIASRERRIWQRLAEFLAAHQASPNAISIMGMLAGVIAGILLAGTKLAANNSLQRTLWLVAAAGIQLRLLANMLDGMVAIASHKASRLGELYNELPDRVSDVAIIIGAGYAFSSRPMLGYIAACLAILTAYVRAVGKGNGVGNLFIGPMAKPHRMFVLTIAALLMALLPQNWRPAWASFTLPSFALAIIIIGSLVTVIRRLRVIVLHLQQA
jgi:phosphatidylglycerophosphate synthase